MREITLEKFAGPLELLLGMVEEKKLSINEVSLAQVADQYIVHLKNAQESSKAELATFLVIAATLMLIKSRSLVPHLELSEDEEMDIQELETRLLTYKFFKEFSQQLAELARSGEHSFGREAYVGMGEVFSPPEKLTAPELASALESVFAMLPIKEVLPEDVIERAISLEEKIDELKARLTRAARFSFSSKDKAERGEVIVGFLALLELIKEGFLFFEQSALFDTIEVSKHES